MLQSVRKRKNKSDKSCLSELFSKQVTCDVYFTGKPVIQCDIPFVQMHDLDLNI